MGIKATVAEVRVAHAAFTNIMNATKLGADPTWSVSRMLGKLRSKVKEFERAQLKLYKDAGGYMEGNGITMPALQPRDDGESLEDWEKRVDLHRARVNGLQEEIEKLLDKEVEIDLEPIKLSLFPKKRKNDDGEQVEVTYRATDFADAGPFLVNEADTKD